MAAAANALLPGVGDTAAVCVSLFHGPAGFDVPPARLAMLNHPGVVAATACPQTYESMSQQVDSLGRPLDTRPRPPGHVDPYRLQIFDPHPDGPGHAWVEMRLGRGLAGTEYLCSVFSTGRERRAFCRPGASWVH